MCRKVLTKATLLICLVLATALGLGCPPDAEPRLTVTAESLALRVTEVEGGIEIENRSGVDCIVYVRSPEGEQQFELDVGKSVTVTGITPPIEVGVVGG